MFSLLAKLINVVALTIRNVLLGASFTGHVIFVTITTITSSFLNLIDSVIIFLHIVYEDNVSTFAEDIPNFANDVFDTLVAQLSFIWNGLSNIYHDTHCKIYAIALSAKWLIDSVVLVVCEVSYIIKAGAICLGDSIWFILTFVPVHLPQLLRILMTYVTSVVVNTVVSAYMTLLKFTNFLTDVPLESFIGIISAVIITRLCIYFRESIQLQVIQLYWSIKRNVFYLYYVLYNYFTNSEVQVITRLVTSQEVGTRMNTSIIAANDAADAADILCVICQERQKCVLTLPCRHICLCSECCMRLYGYQRTCPICRTFIYHSVTVYL